MRRLSLAVVAATTSLILGTTTTTASAAEWRQTTNQSFHLLTALQRSQGVATDGQYWYFSWQFGLSKVTLDGESTLTSKTLAIPAEFLAQGDNHIGDIDYYQSRLYVPIEDGSAYQHGHVAVFDAATLEYTGISYDLPQSVQRDGVPWVAVDPARGYFYSSEYNATALNAYSLTDGHLVKQIPLSQPVPKVQGAKIYQGQLYASSNGPTKSVFRIDPDSGSVSDVLDSGLSEDTETEGLVFLSRPDGSAMHVLDVAPNRLSVNFRHYEPS